MYDKVSDFYDRLFSFDSRWTGQRALFRSFLSKYPLNYAAEIGCGTGVQALALASCGVVVSGLDISLPMLQKARANAQKVSQSVTWLQGGMTDASAILQPHSQDAVFLLGNTLCHLTHPRELAGLWSGLEQVVRPGGYCILQLLNYIPILGEKKRILDIHREGAEEFIRFYDFVEGQQILFNILYVQERGGRLESELFSQPLYAFLPEEVQSSLQAAGWQVAELCSELDGSPFDPRTSQTLCIIARRS